MLLVAAHRRREGQQQFFDPEPCDSRIESPDRRTDEQVVREGDAADGIEGPELVEASSATASRFRTSGSSVAMLAVLSVGAYITLIVLTWRLGQ